MLTFVTNYLVEPILYSTSYMHIDSFLYMVILYSSPFSTKLTRDKLHVSRWRKEEGRGDRVEKREGRRKMGLEKEGKDEKEKRG